MGYWGAITFFQKLPYKLSTGYDGEISARGLAREKRSTDSKSGEKFIGKKNLQADRTSGLAGNDFFRHLENFKYKTTFSYVVMNEKFKSEIFFQKY